MIRSVIFKNHTLGLLSRSGNTNVIEILHSKGGLHFSSLINNVTYDQFRMSTLEDFKEYNVMHNENYIVSNPKDLKPVYKECTPLAEIIYDGWSRGFQPKQSVIEAEQSGYYVTLEHVMDMYSKHDDVYNNDMGVTC